jgi:NAD(P)-dependent dehydrogenase (short-subunit alcohol dehydrogenase family)
MNRQVDANRRGPRAILHSFQELASQAGEQHLFTPLDRPPVRRVDRMTSLRGKLAVVTGASSGVGKATVQALIADGVRVTAVARGGDGLHALRSEAGPGVETVQADASDPAIADRLIRELRPDLVVLAAGIQPPMGPLAEQTWESFSETWNTDLKAAFHFMSAALTTPLREGSVVIVVSSGAAINGSHLSGGYAGAKRMQWLLAGYAQTQANAKKLGVRFLAVLPKQLIEGTKISALASSSYGAWLGISPQEYMGRFEVPLDAQKVTAAIVGGLRGDVAAGVTAIAVSGKGVEPLG